MIKDLKRISLIVWIFLTVYYLFILFINTQKVGLGRAWQDMIDQSNKLTLENQLLENEIAEKSSLRHISEEASKAGFIKPEKILYIK